MSVVFEWVDAKKRLPPPEEAVLVCVKNKNKDGGIALYDFCHHNGKEWAERTYTWEDILFWALPVEPIDFRKS